MLLAFSGHAQTGKDSCAAVLVKEMGFERRAFADKLRDMLYALNPHVRIHTVDQIAEFPDPFFVPVQDLVDKYGWEVAKRESDVRVLLQRLGTEAGRKILGENVWTNACLNGYQSCLDKVAITDCRYMNEAETVKAFRGFMIRVERPGYGPVNSHPSETALDFYPFFDAVIHNDGTLDDLRNKVLSTVRTLTCADSFNDCESDC